MNTTFGAQLEEHFQNNLIGANPLQRAIREKAWERFLQMGLAEKKQPGYQYFPFSTFYRETFAFPQEVEYDRERLASLVRPESRRSYVVLHNGKYVPTLSDTSGLPDKVAVVSLKDALQLYGSFLQGRLAKALKEEADPFAALNLALVSMGLFVYVPPQTLVEAPLQCIHLLSNDTQALCSPRMQFFLGKHSKLKVSVDYHCLKDCGYFSNAVMDIALEEGAQFEHSGLINPCSNGWCFEAVRATLKKDSVFNSLTFTKGTKSVKQDYRIALQGENAACDLKGIALLAQNRQSHLNILVDHQEPHGRSNQLFKTVLADTSRSSFEGKIYVHPEAQKTQAYQLNQNLLLSNQALANSKPNLEIFADDVKASHGATVTKLRPEHLFYLATRGIPTDVAKKLLLKGFILDLVEGVESMKEQAEKFAVC